MKTIFVLPAYNEEGALTPLVTEIHEVFTEEKKPYEVVIVNDGSSDGTLRVANQLAENYPITVLDNGQNRGLAETIKNGLIEASRRAQGSDVIVAMDADNTHPPGLALRMLSLIREGNDVVIGSRYQLGSHVRGLSGLRKFLSYGAAYLFRAVFPIPGVKDYTCGYRAYRAEHIQALYKTFGRTFITEQGFSCTVELLLRLRNLDLVFVEVPMVLRYDNKVGASKMRVFKTIMDTLKLLVRKRFEFGSDRASKISTAVKEVE